MSIISTFRPTTGTFSKFLAVGAICGTLGLAAPSAPAHEYSAGALKIGHPWTRVTPPGAKVAGGFMTVTNTGTEADKLTGGTFELSERVEIHEMKVEGGIMRMNEVAGGLEIPPGGTVELRPGSYHVMFMGLSASPQEGKPVSGTLTFEKAGTIDIIYAVAPLGAKTADDKGAPKADHGGHGAHGGHDMKEHGGHGHH